MRVIVIGSCLSGLVFKNLKGRVEQMAIFPHLRVDFLNDILEGSLRGHDQVVHDHIFDKFNNRVKGERQ
jgi:hypothetical protein